nr:MAG TPA: hypothetical protein [Bacteriophage sp.]
MLLVYVKTSICFNISYGNTYKNPVYLSHLISF